MKALLGVTVSLAVVVAGALVAPAVAARPSGTAINGEVLQGDTTWTSSGSPYTIRKAIQIPAGVTLTVEPGVRVINSGASHLFKVGGDLRILRKVGGYDAAEGAVFRPELGGKGLQPVAAAGGQNEPEAQPGIAEGKLPPDARGRAGDPDSFG